MSIACVIPARGGSKGVPRKNIKVLNGFPLIYYSIIAGKEAFGEVYVTTEDEEIASVAERYGAKIIQRPIEFALDEATDYDWLKHTFSILKCDNLAIMRPTTPLRCVSTILEGVSLFGSHPECSSMRSAHEAPESPYKWFELDYDAVCWKRNPLADMPRQTLPKIYIPNGYLDITRRDTVLGTHNIEKKGSAFGESILSFITEPVVEVDSQSEFDYLEYILKK